VKKLNLQDFESIAEIAGAVAIVVSLIYVGIQVRDSTLAVRSATATDASTAMSEHYLGIGTNAQATQVFLDGITDPDSLSREETAQFIYMIHGLFLKYQAAYYASEQGTLDIEMRESLVIPILGISKQPGFLKFWSQRRDMFKASFRTFVDDLLASGKTNENFEQLYEPRTPQ
jgi:hypothetical protein